MRMTCVDQTKGVATNCEFGSGTIGDVKILIRGNDVTCSLRIKATSPWYVKTARVASLARGADLMALEPLLHRKTAQISGGQQQPVT
ncbi:hypothetical protein SAMN05443635_10788 [Roseobacter denitrificans OCh 114]|uniref:Sugar ABC transporter, ATP-binding protein, putative n=1 Tax=Roseobacter denitrificans (strain ATCC 33942 / OCh 114) TaxID=375451 RepID=Q162N7_ROSDO|nr:sugar ABC transporter ATP-binding protein [Roseobacter denitrificans]ABG33056.1 sugar ABC transporter, ATP-binding protein, putative [Roseobacter denitrificans OCh 114]SFG08745.1 hypothetical protein SAMN05443635_10788 [Roseobacter denitrificans OCh 114]